MLLMTDYDIAINLDFVKRIFIEKITLNSKTTYHVQVMEADGHEYSICRHDSKKEAETEYKTLVKLINDFDFKSK